MPTLTVPANAEGGRRTRVATRFFWSWLIMATAMSVTGNVAHAVIAAPRNAVILAAGAALVPPVVLLASTHSVALLVRTCAGGITYWCALLMTLALASCAFVLSFDALRSLAVTLGLPVTIAWLWPCAIDVAIAQATLCLLSLNRRTAVDVHGREDCATRSSRRTQRPHADPMRGVDGPRDRTGATGLRISRPVLSAKTPTAAMTSGDPTVITRWASVAETLVQQGITTKDTALVATILAQREAGIPPSTIGRAHKVHHTTVGRILSAADEIVDYRPTPVDTGAE